VSTITLEVQDRGKAIPLLEAALQRQAAYVQMGIAKTRQRLQVFEQQYGCTLQEADTSGVSIDPLDRVEWEGETEMLRRLEMEKAVLTTIGYINLAILKFKNDYAAYTEGAPRYEGLHHFGFKVDNLEEARKQVEAAGATFQPLGGKATGQGVVDVEVKYYLPHEVRIDLSEHGWLTLTL
jgi:hypothetical protein